MSEATNTKKTKVSSYSNLAALQELVQYMKSQGVTKFAVGDIAVEFDQFAGGDKKPVLSLDDRENSTQHIRDLLKKELSETAAEELWSVG